MKMGWDEIVTKEECREKVYLAFNRLPWLYNFFPDQRKTKLRTESKKKKCLPCTLLKIQNLFYPKYSSSEQTPLQSPSHTPLSPLSNTFLNHSHHTSTSPHNLLRNQKSTHCTKQDISKYPLPLPRPLHFSQQSLQPETRDIFFSFIAGRGFFFGVRG